ncbi:MAG: HAD family hydrolase [Bacteroidetes bacterium]|nr:HAD family hydrolase [Bacteroidota bacterium]
MNNASEILSDLKADKDFFVGIDSDGCVFDSMEIKHKECFCPEFIKHFELQQISKYARETWEFVNLYSKTRGVNRFKAVIRTFELLSERNEVRDRKVNLLNLSSLINWVEAESKLGNPALIKYLETIEDSVLEKALMWSMGVNNAVERMVTDLPPFPLVADSLLKMSQFSDIIVVSQTPLEALEREWKQHGIDEKIKLIAGQEYGTKSEHIKYAAVGKYLPERILMIGDAPGDLIAAKDNGVLFYPIIPGSEEKSWQRLYNEALEFFRNEKYKGEYEDQLLAEFENSLPENPTWGNKV